MYTIPSFLRSSINSVEKTEGERIEEKIERIMSNKEPIKDGSPLIYTERKAGVMPENDIRTDRWEVAADAMDKVAKAKIAKSEGRTAPKKEEKSDKEVTKDGDIVEKNKDVGDEPTQASDK